MPRDHPREFRPQPTRDSRPPVTLTEVQHALEGKRRTGDRKQVAFTPRNRIDHTKDLLARNGIERAKHLLGLDGHVMTLADLPPPSTKRWVVRRKAEVVLAVQAGVISLEDACKRYQLTIEEFAEWRTAIERHGLRGLSLTHLQHYRQRDKE